LTGGTSRHSAQAGTLPLIINALERAGVPYTLTAFPRAGYHLEGRPDAKPDQPIELRMSPAMEALPFIREFEAYQKSEKIDPPLTLPMYMKERYRGGGWKLQDERMSSFEKVWQNIADGTKPLRPLPLGRIEFALIIIVGVAFMLGLCAFALGVCSTLGCK